MISVAAIPMIPVTDELIQYPKNATKEHKAKVTLHNDTIQEIHELRMELQKLQETVIDMRNEITEEFNILEGKEPTMRSDASFSKSSDEEAEDLNESDRRETGVSNPENENNTSGYNNKSSNAGSVGKDPIVSLPSKKRKSKPKNGKGRERAKSYGSEMREGWDYRLDLSESNKPSRRAPQEVVKTLEQDRDIVPKISEMRVKTQN